MNWDNPEERARLIERIGVDAYDKAFLEHVTRSTVSTVGGHAIRPVQSRFGRVFVVGNTGKGYSTQRAAENYARANPTNIKKTLDELAKSK